MIKFRRHRPLPTCGLVGEVHRARVLDRITRAASYPDIREHLREVFGMGPQEFSGLFASDTNLRIFLDAREAWEERGSLRKDATRA